MSDMTPTPDAQEWRIVQQEEAPFAYVVCQEHPAYGFPLHYKADANRLLKLLIRNHALAAKADALAEACIEVLPVSPESTLDNLRCRLCNLFTRGIDAEHEDDCPVAAYRRTEGGMG